MSLIKSPAEKALEKSVIPDKAREFLPTESEWKARHAVQQITRFSLAATGSFQVVFVVPANHTFFLTGATISASAQATLAGATRTATLFKDDSGLISSAVLNVLVNDVDAGAQASLTYSMPILIEEGNTMILSNSTTTTSACTIVGWLEKKEVKP